MVFLNLDLVLYKAMQHTECQIACVHQGWQAKCEATHFTSLNEWFCVCMQLYSLTLVLAEATADMHAFPHLLQYQATVMVLEAPLPALHGLYFCILQSILHAQP